MGLKPQNIGTAMPHGQAGSYARQPEMIVGTKPLGGTKAVAFGTPLEYDEKGNVVAMGATSTAADFVGIAAREVKSALTYLEQGTGVYAPHEPVSVFQRGCINVNCQKGTPKAGGKVYLRTAANESYPTAAVGGLEAEEDKNGSTSNTVELTNCQWAGPKDANGIAELRILTMVNA